MKNQIKLKIQKGYYNEDQKKWKETLTWCLFGQPRRDILCDKFVRKAFQKYPVGTIANLWIVKSRQGLITLKGFTHIDRTWGIVNQRIFHNYFKKIPRDAEYLFTDGDNGLYEDLKEEISKLFRIKDQSTINVDVYLEILDEKSSKN